MAVTEEEVHWCYREILGRAPESVEIVRMKAAQETDFRSMILGFITSPEYRRKVTFPCLVPLDRNERVVDTAGSALELSLIKDRIRETWTQLGLERPHDSILSGAGYLPADINEESEERFFASGLQEAAMVESILSRFKFSYDDSKVCVEYGCGLGRVTFALASFFKEVHGYDISVNHLRLARQHAADFGVENVEFHPCSVETISEALIPCDFFYSRLVFQHNPPPLIRELLASSLAALRPGGMAIFQLPTYGADYEFRIKDYVASSRRRDIEMHCFPQREVFRLIADARCSLIEVNEDTAVGRYGEWVSNTFVVQRPVA